MKNVECSTWKSKFPRGKNHNKTETKTTVSLYLSKDLVKSAKICNLNLSRVTEQALSSILDYMQSSNIKSYQNSSVFLSTGSFPKESVRVPRAGFEHAIIGDVTLTIPFSFLVYSDLIGRGDVSHFGLGIFPISPLTFSLF